MERTRRNSATSTASQAQRTVVPQSEAVPSNWQGFTNSRRPNSINTDLNSLSSHPQSEQNDETGENLDQNYQPQSKQNDEIDENLDQNYQLVRIESKLKKSLRAPDSLKNKKAKAMTYIAIEKGKEENKISKEISINKNTNLKITKVEEGENSKQSFGIEFYNWNSKNKIKKRMETIEASIAESEVERGSTKQTTLEDINEARQKTVEILPDDESGIKQEDVYQNGVSNCHLQAALIAIAKQNPQQILKMVTENENHVIVKFYFYDDKLPNAKDLQQQMTKKLTLRHIFVNKSLLLDDKGQLVYGGKIDDNSYLWPAFIEKAWAVVKGGYAESAMGQAGDVFRAITGEGVSTSFEMMDNISWDTYDQLRTALKERRGAVLSTQVFAKQGIKKIINKMKKPSAPSDQPHGDIRVLHAYAVLDMNLKDLTADDFQNSIPNVTLTLRDPRDSKDKTFKRTLEQVVNSGKFNTVHTGYNSKNQQSNELLENDDETAFKDTNNTKASAAQQILKKWGLEEQIIPGDGDCLYNALINMGVPYNSVSDFRNAVADYVDENYNNNEVIQSHVDASGRGLDGYTQDIRRLGNYEDEASDAASELISMLLNIRIFVINENAKITPAHNGSTGDIYWLLRYNSPAHYNATRTATVTGV
jgi:Calpain family cysteine protease